MRLHRMIPAALAAIIILPSAGTAQEVRAGSITAVRVGSRGFIGVATQEVPSTSGVSRQRAVTDVITGSPAEKAGVMKGDTILRINGAAATAAVMATPYEPGDTITMRVRRNGREREVRVIAGERPQGMFERQVLIPTEVNNRIQIIQDRIALSMDTTKFRGVYVERMRGDTSVIVVGRDTIRTLLRPGMTALMIDTLHASMLRLPHDSVFTYLRAREGNIFRMGSDTLARLIRPAEIAAGAYTIGLRAVAGAELHELNPELGASFGVQRGVLVLDAREGTPAARAGLRGGDVIVRANGAEVSSISDLRRAIDGARAGNPVQLRVVRRGQNVDITLGRD